MRVSVKFLNGAGAVLPAATIDFQVHSRCYLGPGGEPEPVCHDSSLHLHVATGKDRDGSVEWSDAGGEEHVSIKSAI